MLKNILKLILQIWWRRQITKYHQFLKYCFVGAVGAVIDIFFLWFLVQSFHFYYLLAASVSFILAVINNYFLNKYWTFQDKRNNHLKQFSGFLLVSAVGLLINLMIIYWLVEKMAVYYLISKLVAIVVVTVWNFSINKYLIFKTT